MPHCLGLLLHSPLRPNQESHVVGWVFFLILYNNCKFSHVFLFWFCQAVKLTEAGEIRKWESESDCYQVESETDKSVEYIGILITWPTPNARYIFTRDKFKTRGKQRHVTTLSNQVLETIYFDALQVLFREQVSLGFYFSWIFSSTYSSPTV